MKGGGEGGDDDDDDTVEIVDDLRVSDEPLNDDVIDDRVYHDDSKDYNETDCECLDWVL